MQTSRDGACRASPVSSRMRSRARGFSQSEMAKSRKLSRQPKPMPHMGVRARLWHGLSVRTAARVAGVSGGGVRVPIMVAQRAGPSHQGSKKRMIMICVRAFVIIPCAFPRVGFTVASVHTFAMGSATAVRVAIMVASARERPCFPSNLPCRTESSTAQERHEAYLAAPARFATSV